MSQILTFNINQFDIIIIKNVADYAYDVTGKTIFDIPHLVNPQCIIVTIT